MARKRFAIIDLAKDCVHTMESANEAADLEGMYPPAEYMIVDMEGKDDMPFKAGAYMQDLTIDIATSDWNWKLTDVQIEDRALAERHFLLRKRILGLMTAKEMADVLGAEYVPVSISLQDQITEIQNELGPL